jgi:hypothetical protein
MSHDLQLIMSTSNLTKDVNLHLNHRLQRECVHSAFGALPSISRTTTRDIAQYHIVPLGQLSSSLLAENFDSPIPYVALGISALVSTMPDVQPGRLQEVFNNVGFEEHGSKWDDLWKDNFTPWDRGGPSLALGDVLAERRDLFPSGPPRRRTALVPGCGKGHDVLFLAAIGYDAYGLDYSASATKEAIDNEQAFGDADMYRPREEVGQKGKVSWLTGDFFADDWLREVDVEGKFDLIFDYTVRVFPDNGHDKHLQLAL